MHETETEILPRLARVIEETFQYPSEKVTRDTTADQVSGWNSVAHVVFLVSVEDAFGIRLDPNKVLEVENVGALADIIAAQVD